MMNNIVEAYMVEWISKQILTALANVISKLNEQLKCMKEKKVAIICTIEA